MKIIDNINSNHNKSIQSILSESDEMVLVSPFLTEDFSEFVHDVSELGIKSIILITTLKDNNLDLFNKANSLYSFCLSCKLNNVKFEVRIDNKLHGKIYIGIKNGFPLKAIITSANFTENGLSYSHEWGVEISDTDKIQKLLDDIFKVVSNPLSLNDIDIIVKSIDEFFQKHELNDIPKPKLNVTDIFIGKLKNSNIKNQINLSSSSNEDIKYFLKPIGSSENPIDDDWQVGNINQDIYFSKRKPVSVRIGDILICYAVGSRKLLGYFRVINEPKLTNNKDRWPWLVETENLYPEYSSKWSSYDNTLTNIVLSFPKNIDLTFVGGKSLGALNYGADKISLNEQFAKHIINVILNSVV